MKFHFELKVFLQVYIQAINIDPKINFLPFVKVERLNVLQGDPLIVTL